MSTSLPMQTVDFIGTIFGFDYSQRILNPGPILSSEGPYHTALTEPLDNSVILPCPPRLYGLLCDTLHKAPSLVSSGGLERVYTRSRNDLGKRVCFLQCSDIFDLWE